MNVADSAKLAEVLESVGYLPTPNSELADLILVNTCVVRQTAEDRAAWFVTSLKGQKKIKPNLKIALCGCIVTEPGRDLKKQFPHVDLFIPPNSPQVLEAFLLQVAGCKLKDKTGEHETCNMKPVTAFVTIMTGCDNYCSYCVVPYVRGRESSRSMEEVLEEIRGLGEQGIREITLLGQNVNSYKYGLAELFRRINSLMPGSPDLRISFLTSHPRDMSDEIIETVAELPYVAKDFILPLQSGDDEILAKMNRGYTFDYYLGRIRKIRELIHGARISSDLIVGFPGETEEQFQRTLKALELCRFNDVHMFAYSERPMVAAAKLPGQLSAEVKQERLQRLIEANRNLLALA
jgi:tRNA-2-methylthio-N6-dimethylallyladenosine synthase